MVSSIIILQIVFVYHRTAGLCKAREDELRRILLVLWLWDSLQADAVDNSKAVLFLG